MSHLRFQLLTGFRRAIVSLGSSPQKHVWRAKIILMTDEGLGTVAIMGATVKSKTCVWRSASYGEPRAGPFDQQCAICLV